MAKIVRLTESDLVRLVKKVINEQSQNQTSKLVNILTNSGFKNGVEELTRQQNANEGQIGGIVVNYVREKNIPETNVFYKKIN